MQRRKSWAARLSGRLTIVVAVFTVTNTLAFGQSLGPDDVSAFPQSSYDRQYSSPLFTSLESQRLEKPYSPITPRGRLHWFIASTVGPAHITGVAFISAGGTAVNRPGEYGPHWKGAASRFGTGMAGGAAGSAIEDGVGLGFREDPRYFQSPEQSLKSRVGNVARLTFFARNESGRSRLAYARFLGVVGGNFLSNSWRVHSEANTRDALLRSSEGFAGRLAANAFKEFWPDMKKWLVHKSRAAQLNLEMNTPADNPGHE